MVQSDSVTSVLDFFPLCGSIANKDSLLVAFVGICRLNLFLITGK